MLAPILALMRIRTLLGLITVFAGTVAGLASVLTWGCIWFVLFVLGEADFFLAFCYTTGAATLITTLLVFILTSRYEGSRETLDDE